MLSLCLQSLTLYHSPTGVTLINGQHMLPYPILSYPVPFCFLLLYPKRMLLATGSHTGLRVPPEVTTSGSANSYLPAKSTVYAGPRGFNWGCLHSANALRRQNKSNQFHQPLRHQKGDSSSLPKSGTLDPSLARILFHGK